MYEVAQEVQLAPLEKASERASRLHDQSIDDLRAWAPSERGQREQTRASCDVVMQALDALQGMREATTLAAEAARAIQWQWRACDREAWAAFYASVELSTLPCRGRRVHPCP